MLLCITGTMGSGKSSVTRFLAGKLDAEIISADELCRTLMHKDAEGYKRFVDLTGEEYLDQNCCIDRVRLKEKIAENDKVREILESVLHPLAFEEIEKHMELSRDSNQASIYEIPLYHEKGRNIQFDKVITVFARDYVTRCRILKRDKISDDLIHKYQKVQHGSMEKALKSDMVIDNSGCWLETVVQVLRLVNHIRRKIG